MQEWDEGDLIRWWYRDTKGMFEPYWCKSQFAIYENSRFRDTYWHSNSDRWCLPLKDCEWEYLGNLNSFRIVSPYELAYYDEADRLDISHPNAQGMTYVRKSAKKSVGAISQALKQQLDEAQAKLRSAQWEIERIEEKLQNVTTETYL